MARDDRRVAITARQGKRIAKAVKAVENATQAGRRPGRVVNWNPGVVRAVVTTAIPTGTDASPSNAGRAVIRHKDRSGAWQPSGDPVTVWNDHTMTTSVAVGKVVKLAWIEGEWWVVSADCSSS